MALQAGLTLSVTLVGGSVVACVPRSGRPSAAAPPAVDTTPTPALKGPLTYVALGASDAAGVGVDYPARDGWVPVLARRLPQPTRLVNMGIPGIRLREALQVELPPTLDARPDLITVWLVVNDVLGGVQLEQYSADLNRLLSQLRAGTQARIALGNIPNAPEASRYLGLPASERRVLTKAWNDAISDRAAAHGAVLVDLFTRWPLLEHPEYIGSDGLHPTVAGYQTLADTFFQVLREQRII